MFTDTKSWDVLNGESLPEYVVSVPYLDTDIPGGWDALRKKHDLYRVCHSWLDVDDDQDSVYLCRLKGRGE